MITYYKGDLFDSDAQALVNTVNTVGVMGKGIALQFKERYPYNFALYKKACDNKEINVGNMFITSFADITGNNRYIINFPTKTTWRKPSEYEYIEKGLQSLKQEITQKQIKSVALPPLGTNNGGLEWTKVKQMIEHYLSDVDCDIRIYEPSEKIAERMKSEKVKMTPARAMLLDVACDMVSYGNFASEFACEKIVYFLQKFGAKDIFKCNFSQAYYGPYSGKVKYLLHYLNGSYLMGMQTLNNKPFDIIYLTNDTRKVTSEFLGKQENAEYKTICGKTKSYLNGFYTDFSLELLSTVDYIVSANNLNLDKDIDTLVNEVQYHINQWSKRKQKLFDNKEYIQIALEQIKTFSLIPEH